MILRRPLFFLLVDSWLVLAGGAGVAFAGCVESADAGVDALAGCIALESVESPVVAGCDASVVGAGVSEAAGGVSVAGVFAASGGRAFGLPGVIVSTAAVLPMLEAEAAFALGCKLNPMVS